MSMKFYTNINLNTNQIENIGIHRGDVFPTDPSPVTGQLFYLTLAATGYDVGLYVFNGSEWKPVAFGTNFYASYPTTATKFIPGDTLLRDSTSSPESDRGLWICKFGYTSTPDWSTEKTKWEFLSDTTYCGPYTTGASYAPGQVVTYHDHVYVAKNSITGAPAILNPADWSLSGSNYTGTFSDTALYSYGEMVEHDGNKYICTVPITTAGAFNISQWERIETSLWRGVYDETKTYFKNEIVNYDGIVYVANRDILTPEAFASGKWDQLLSNDYRGNWATGNYYAKGEKVKYNGALYVCVNGHTSGGTFTPGNWTAIARSTEWPTFDKNEVYVAGDVVNHNGETYIATVSHSAGVEFDGKCWNSLYQIFKGAYNDAKTYQKGDEVSVTEGTPAKTTYYLCIADDVTGTFDATKWQKLGGDEQYKGDAIDTTTDKAKGKLAVGDIFRYEKVSGTVYFFEVIQEIAEGETFVAADDISKVSLLSPKSLKQTVTLTDAAATGTITLPLGAQLIDVKTVDTANRNKVVVDEKYTEEVSTTHATVVFSANIATGSTESITCEVYYR